MVHCIFCSSFNFNNGYEHFYSTTSSGINEFTSVFLHINTETKQQQNNTRADRLMWDSSSSSWTYLHDGRTLHVEWSQSAVRRSSLNIISLKKNCFVHPNASLWAIASISHCIYFIKQERSSSYLELTFTLYIVAIFIRVIKTIGQL